MDKISQYRFYIQKIIRELGKFIPDSNDVETQYIFDEKNDHYQLFQVGWIKNAWIHGCIVHFDIKNGKIWLQHNGTEMALTDNLLSFGVPKEDIVLGFQAPYKRKYTGFSEG